ASILVFLYEQSLDDFELTKFFNNYGVVPYELTGKGDIAELIREVRTREEENEILNIDGAGDFYRAFGRPAAALYEGGPPSVWLTLFSSMFMHGGWLHLGGNMLFLWVFGDNIEDRLGRLKYLIFYIAAGLAAVGAQLLVNLNSGIPTIGASGAIAGVLGAYLLLFPRSQIRTVIIFFFITYVSLPAYLLIGIWIFQQFFNGFLSLGADFAGGVAYWAHVGGFVFGAAVIGALLATGLLRRETQPQF
ncbi:MAG: rhomboid family intramembrane serine protease, partial [Dehalococcoidia bacterium]